MIFEKLNNLRQTSTCQSTDYLLSVYFMEHTKKEELDLDIVSKNTKISKSTIQRFARQLDYASYNSFVRELITTHTKRQSYKAFLKENPVPFSDLYQLNQNDSYIRFINELSDKFLQYKKVVIIGDLWDLNHANAFLPDFADIGIDILISSNPFDLNNFLKNIPLSDEYFYFFIYSCGSLNNTIDQQTDFSIIEILLDITKRDFATFSQSPYPSGLNYKIDNSKYPILGVHQRTLVAVLMCDLIVSISKKNSRM